MASTTPSEIYRCEVSSKCHRLESGECSHAVILTRIDSQKVEVPLMRDVEIAAIFFVLPPVKIENPAGPYHFDRRILRARDVRVDIDVGELLTKLFSGIPFEPLNCLSESEFRLKYTERYRKIRRT